MNHALALRVTGFIISVLLTLASYYIIIDPTFLDLSVRAAITVIFSIALIQALVQLICFIDVWEKKELWWNLAVFVSTVGIIFIIVYFSIWIINHLNYNMH